ncbi:DUF2637 domain-containing protein [Streptomyces mirabilis]|uniref:DUF2637 domain-containing protein n=1 Tax=Streptomyces mirabilis TaxID=68239 RepID=A0ABU3V4X6_9ACTN|nr:DUF2637 domain-containing protein [Streptomyces mirabilis]MCX5355574.1 DUF2637 domain-containing protein [Streptomyces mirabilis]MDU9001220.1 DUF2637 domain-containing protein [Streptomyces mirabilis]
MHRILIGVVVAGALVIAGIGFAGSYAAVRELALKKGFGNFAYVFPIGIDAGICVLLALDLLLTWIRIPFPLLRQTAWLLTVATIAFNGAAAWPDPLGVGMHAVIPVLFVVLVEAARHAIGRIADITADKHMEGVRLTRWMLSPLPTFLLWRRMKLWELRSYEQVIKLEQDRLVYQARLHSRFGRAWRRKAPVESLMPLRLARYGVPLAETAPAGLAAAGIESVLLSPASEPIQTSHEAAPQALESREYVKAPPQDEHAHLAWPPQGILYGGGYDLSYEPDLQDRHRNAQGPGAAATAHAADGEDLRFLDAYRSWLQEFRVFPTASQFSYFLLHEYKISTGTGAPLSEEQLLPLLQRLEQMNREASASSRTPQAETGDADLDSNEPWNENLHPNTAPVELENSTPAFQADRAGELAGASADRTGGRNRVVVQMRIPAEPYAPEDVPASRTSEPPFEDGADDEQQPDETQQQQETLPSTAPSDLKGLELVEFYYMRLPRELQQMSANELAPKLVELTGYKQNTVRKYIGEVRKALTAESADA